MPIERKKADCPCCEAKLKITLILTDNTCSDAWLSRERNGSFDPYDDTYDDTYDDYYDPYDDMYDDYRDDPYDYSICLFCDGFCYGRCEYDAETEAICMEEAGLEGAEFANILHGSVKAKRYDRRKKQNQKLKHKRPPAKRSMKAAKVEAWMAKIRPSFRFVIELPFQRFPLRTQQGD